MIVQLNGRGNLINNNESDCNINDEELVSRVINEMLCDLDINNMSILFRTIGDKTRLKILWALNKNELCVCDLCGVVNMTKSTVSHQLKLLKHINMVKFEKRGKNCFYKLNDECVANIINVALGHLHHKER